MVESSPRLPDFIDPTVAADSLREHTATLVKAFRHCLSPLADSLYSQSIIPEDAHRKALNKYLDEDERSRALVSCVEARLEIEPSDFKKFVNILNSKPFLGTLGSKLVQSYCKLVNTIDYDITDEDTTELQFIEGIEKAIAKSGKIDRKLANIIFVGPTGSGKTSLMNRLLGRLKKIVISTGVCEDIVTVDINIPNPTTLQAAAMLENEWKEMKCEASFVRQIGQESIYETKGVTVAAMSTEPQPAASPVNDKGPSIHPSIHYAIKEYGFDNFKQYLKKTFSLYLRDTGGQVEFQEMLALLTFGPSIFFFVFRTFLDLQSKFEVKYRTSADEFINCYTSSITTEEALLQCLASVYAMDASDVVKTHEPLVFIVGTHIDKLGSERDAKIASLNQHLDFIINDNGFENLVQYADRDKGHVMFTVDNSSLENEDHYFQLIRSRINDLVMKRDKFNIEYPINYLLVCLDLQNIKKSILTLDEFSDLAASYGITGDQVFHLLQFLQIRIGLIRYFDVEGLRHIIVKEPRVLFNGATDLVVQTYSSKSRTEAEARDLENKGIITLSVFKSVVTAVDGISPEIFLKLLVHLRIAAPICKPGDDKEERYFLPCVLNHVPEYSEEDQQTCVSPLAIKFKCHHCPKGIYGVLVTRLMQLEGDNSHITFELLEDKIFKDQVSFVVKSGYIQDEISLKIFSSHIEVKYFPEESDDRPSPLGEACNNVRQIIDLSTSSSLKDLHYNKKKVEPFMCFECEHCKQLHPVEERNDYHITRCGRKVNHLSPSAKFWYYEEAAPSGASEHGGSSSSVVTGQGQQQSQGCPVAPYSQLYGHTSVGLPHSQFQPLAASKVFSHRQMPPGPQAYYSQDQPLAPQIFSHGQMPPGTHPYYYSQHQPLAPQDSCHPQAVSYYGHNIPSGPPLQPPVPLQVTAHHMAGLSSSTNTSSSSNPTSMTHSTFSHEGTPSVEQPKHFCTESNRSDLLKELLPLASEWKNIGTLLGIPDLDAIQQDYHQSRDCMREMINIWLKMIDPEPTWERLVEALKCVDPRKAQDMFSKYITQ